MSNLDLVLSEVMDEIIISSEEQQNEQMQQVLNAYNMAGVDNIKRLKMIAWDQR